MQEFKLETFLAQYKDRSFLDSLFCDQKVSFEILYDSVFPSSQQLRKIVEKITEHIGIPPKWRARMVLIIDELNNNAIEHGSIQDDINRFHLEISRQSEGIYDFHIFVADTGKGAHAKKAAQMEQLRDTTSGKDFSQHDSIRGRGLFLIISRLVDELYFEDMENGGLKVGFRKELNITQD